MPFRWTPPSKPDRPKYEPLDKREVSKKITRNANKGGDKSRPPVEMSLLEELKLEFLQGVEVYYTPFKIEKGKVISYEIGSIINGNNAFIGLVHEPPVLEGVRWRKTMQKNGIPIYYGIEENKYSKEA